MAFGYKVPSFNLWCRRWRVYGTDHFSDASRYYVGPEYSVCSFTASQEHVGLASLSLPKYTNVRWARNTFRSRGDIVQVAGNEMFFWRIQYAAIIGAGWPNEYVRCHLECAYDESWPGGDELTMGQCTTALEPPEDFTPWGLLVPADFWQDPQEVSDHPPP